MPKKLHQAKQRYFASNVIYVGISLIGFIALSVSLLFIAEKVYIDKTGVSIQAQAIKYYSATPNPGSVRIVEYEYSVDGKKYRQTQDISEKYFQEKPEEFTIKYQTGDPGGDVLVSIRDKFEQQKYRKLQL